jgi:hypothetical protein
MHHQGTLFLCLLQLVGGSPLIPRAECETIQIEPAQGCYQLAERCGITAEELIEFNPKDNLCTTLRIGQRVCCTPGDMPVIASNPDGSCKETVVEKGMNCDKLAAYCGISLPELHTFNNLTQTELCSSLSEGRRVCCTPGHL